MDRQFLLANVLLRADPGEGAAMTEELKPCPFCGRSPQSVDVQWYRIEPGALGAGRNTKWALRDKVICACGCSHSDLELWNRRANRDAVPSAHAASVAAGISDMLDDEDEHGRTPGDYFRMGYRAARADRDAVLEEAARVADRMHAKNGIGPDIAAAIRAFKEKPNDR
jgi:hypothetical protein